jgi:hypothetical protein
MSMSTPLNPQEIYLLERYSSLSYFGELRDHFAAMVKAAEDALAEFMRHLPPDYRAQHLSLQPDVTWGETVLPNLRWTLDGLNKGYIRISHGDWDALGLAGNVRTAFSGISRDYPWDWMPEAFALIFDNEWIETSYRKSNISITSQAYWSAGDLTTQYTDSDRGPLNSPPSWPQYRTLSSVRVKTDDKVPRNGIYLPDIDGSCAQVLIEGYEAWGATVLRDPNDPENQAFDRKPTTWTLVERVADSGGGIPGDPDPIKAGIRLRCEAGQTCPRAGHWFTPAQANSRRLFQAGEVMPSVGGDYGLTIWQWDERQ